MNELSCAELVRWSQVSSKQDVVSIWIEDVEIGVKVPFATSVLDVQAFLQRDEGSQIAAELVISTLLKNEPVAVQIQFDDQIQTIYVRAIKIAWIFKSVMIVLNLSPSSPHAGFDDPTEFFDDWI